jgi:hypothetical protein
MRSLVPAYEPGTMARAYLALGDDPADPPASAGALAPDLAPARRALAALATAVLLFAAPAMSGPPGGDWATAGKPLATLAREDDDTTSADDADDLE